MSGWSNDRNAPVTSRGLALGLLLAIVEATAGHAQQLLVSWPAPGDTSLVQAVLGAVHRGNPELAARRAALEAAEARGRAAGPAPAAVLSVEAEDVPGGLDLSRANTRVQVDRELLNGGRRAAARSAAVSEVTLASAALGSAESRISALTTQALTQGVGWAAIAGRLEAEDSLLASAEASLRTRFAVGDARYVEVLRLRAERLRVETEQAAATTEVQAARRRLIGLAPAADSVIPDVGNLVDSLIAVSRVRPWRIGLPQPPNPDSLIAASGAMRLADAALGRAQAARQVVLAEQRSRLTAFLGAQHFAGDNGQFSVGPTLGASLSLPFTAGRAGSRAAAAADQGVRAAGADRQATLSAARTELLVSRDRYEAARARLAVYDAALLRGAQEEREAALAAYRNGELSLLELIDFERALARAETDRIRTVMDGVDALVAMLTAAAGSPTASSESTLLMSSFGTTSNAP